MPDWTKAQSNAINADGSNILVSAAAGSGKTAVLVERVIRLITDESLDINIDELLIVTFTNAAAAEMRSRIALALEKRVEKEPNNTNLLKQLSLLPNAKISTIDSFCINLVREYFFRLDIAQDFNVLEETQKAVIEENVIQQLADSLYESDENKKLIEFLSKSKNDDYLIKSLKRIDNYITSQPFPFEWLDEVCEFYNPDIDINNSVLKKHLVSELESFIDFSLELIAYTESVLYTEDLLYDKYSAVLQQDREIFNALKAKLDGTWDEIRDALLSVKFSSTPYKQKYESDVKQIVVSTRTVYSGTGNLMKSEICSLLPASEDEIKADNEYIYPLFKQLIAVVKDYHNRCFEAKKEINAYTFSDIEHFAIDLLFKRNADGTIERTDLAEEYRSNFREILVDEYQDTNRAQDTLFGMLSNGNNLFMVGDIKQSIYRFRLAMPQIFNEKREAFTRYSENSKSTDQKIIFDSNFRSEKEICEFTNYLFSNIMSKRVGELDYNAEEYLNYTVDAAPTDAPCAELNVINVPENEKADEYEARQVASYIYNKVKNRELIHDDKTVREIRYGDFAILLRSTKNRIDVYSKALSDLGIPVTANNRTSLFENNEVSIFLSLLRVIDNPTLDIPLLATLMSVFYGYSADELARARVNFKADNLYSSVCRDEKTFSAFLTDLKKYREYAASMSVENFLRQVISDSSYLSVISAMGNAEQRQLNVMKLVGLAKSFDAGDSVGLTAFIRYIDSVVENDISLDSADVGGFDSNSVQIMSIHKSKGLEFPVCILADTAHEYNKDDLKSLIQLNDTLGAGFKMINEESMYRYETAQYSCIKNINTYAAMSENLRVLYVAVTRAKEQFVAFASFKDAQNHVNNLSVKVADGSINPYRVKKAVCDGDLLLLAALLHPDGKPLRALCDNDVDYNKTETSRLQVNIINDSVDATADEETDVSYNEELVKEIENKLSFRYEGAKLAGYASKRTASSLDENEQGFKFFARKVPAFISGNTLTGAEKGTAMHAFMQYFDYENTKADIGKEVDRLLENGYISEKQAAALNREKLAEFVNSDIAKRMFSANVLYREFIISAFVPLSQLEDIESDEPVFVQGIADCVFEEDDGIVLLDYKTDYVKDEAELLNLYKKQIGFYKYAVEKTLGKPVKESMLYSFSLGKCCVYK